MFPGTSKWIPGDFWGFCLNFQDFNIIINPLIPDPEEKKLI